MLDPDRFDPAAYVAAAAPAFAVDLTETAEPAPVYRP